MTAQVSPSPLPTSLALAQEAVRRGDRRAAHNICVQLTASDPANEQAWLWRAGTADSLEETIVALSHVLTLDPTNSVARKGLYKSMQMLLRQDAFLAYVSETPDFYRVRNRTNLELAHPKDRAVPEPFPPPTPPSSRAAFRWLGWSLVGLIPAGLGTLICAPIAMLAAVRLLREHPDRANRMRACLVLWIAAALWLLALLFVLLFILHL